MGPRLPGILKRNQGIGIELPGFLRKGVREWGPDYLES
jgi:hypothetical protein